jgi:carbonic anhydrase
VRHIVVCGHTECGGIKALEAAPDPEQEPHIASWLALARPAREQVLAAGVAVEEQYLETIKTNVLMQCENLRSYPCVVDREHSGRLSIHAWLYDLRSGEIHEHDDLSRKWGTIAESSAAEPFLDTD